MTFYHHEILPNVYYAIIYPFFQYGIVVWGNCNASKPLLTRIHILQKQIVCMTTYIDGPPCYMYTNKHKHKHKHKHKFIYIYCLQQHSK